ncbi:MAG: iron-containing alcohol dehydrogenase [Christensenellaceae bacterium]|jgi:alcohol dehydrogenase
MGFRFFMPTEIYFGQGQLGRLAKRRLPGKNALIVTTSGGSVKRNGYLDRLTAQLDEAGAKYTLYDKMLPNPTKDHVTEAAQLAGAQGCDFVIGLGGGSAIDAAKAVALLAANKGDLWDYVFSGSGGKQQPQNPPLPIVAITTTAGTGTEADPWAVITNEASNEKIGFGSDATFPVLSIVDPDLMISVPPTLTAYQGLDALFHATEGYINRRANLISEMFSLKAIELLGEHLPVAVRDGSNMEARENVANANTLAGFVESLSGCISMHSLEHALSAYHPNLAHGAGLIMLSEAYYTYFAKSGKCDKKLVDMAKALGNEAAADPMDFVAALKKLLADCNVDGLKMSDHGIKKEDLAKYLENARETMGHLFREDPLKMSDEDALRILEDSYR